MSHEEVRRRTPESGGPENGQPDAEARNQAFFEVFWGGDTSVYDNHPTSRHRQRFILRSLSRSFDVREAGRSVFDYGCGTGVVLAALQRRLGLAESQLGGCDISPRAVDIVARRLPGGSFHLGAYPVLAERPSAVICSEVIEHTRSYHRILEWAYSNLVAGGVLVLTTQAKPIDTPDRVYGHVQHFDIEALAAELRAIGFNVDFSRRWGFPFYSLQRAITRVFFRQIEENVFGSPLTPWKRLLFGVAYYVYMLHDVIPWGPQIFIRASRPASPGSRG